MYTFYSDNGHGWLKVSTRELLELDLIDKISHYSYISPSRKWVYLEEDSDLTKYLVATNRGHEWFSVNVKSKYSAHSAVRSYPHFNNSFFS